MEPSVNLLSQLNLWLILMPRELASSNHPIRDVQSISCMHIDFEQRCLNGSVGRELPFLLVLSHEVQPVLATRDQGRVNDFLMELVIQFINVSLLSKTIEWPSAFPFQSWRLACRAEICMWSIRSFKAELE